MLRKVAETVTTLLSSMTERQLCIFSDLPFPLAFSKNNAPVWQRKESEYRSSHADAISSTDTDVCCMI
jgi:hypothetical protein